MEYDATCTITDKPCVYAGHILENCRWCSVYQDIFWDAAHPLHDKLIAMLHGEERHD